MRLNKIKLFLSERFNYTPLSDQKIKNTLMKAIHVTARSVQCTIHYIYRYILIVFIKITYQYC